MTLTCDTHDQAELADHRRDERFDDQRPVRLFEPFSGRFFAGMTSNVSTAGACVRLPSTISLRAGRFVTLHDGHDTPCRLDLRPNARLTARVVWTQIDPNDSTVLLAGLELYAATIAAAA